MSTIQLPIQIEVCGSCVERDITVHYIHHVREKYIEIYDISCGDMWIGKIFTADQYSAMEDEILDAVSNNGEC